MSADQEGHELHDIVLDDIDTAVQSFLNVCYFVGEFQPNPIFKHINDLHVFARRAPVGVGLLYMNNGLGLIFTTCDEHCKMASLN